MNIKCLWSSKFIFSSCKYQKVIALAVVVWFSGGMKLQAQTSGENAPEVENKVEVPVQKEVPQPVVDKMPEEKNQELPEIVIKEVPINKIIEITQPFIKSVPVTSELGQNIIKEAPIAQDLKLPRNINLLIAPPKFISPELMAPETPQDKRKNV